MGMITTAGYHNLTIREGKKQAFEKWLSDKEKWREAITIYNGKTVHLDFSWKLISYWYDNTVKEFSELNEFISGVLMLDYEDTAITGTIIFGEHIEYIETKLIRSENTIECYDGICEWVEKNW